MAGPAFGAATGLLRRVGLAELSEDFRRLLRYGRAVDTARLVDEVGFTPRFSTAGAVEDYVAAGRLMPCPPSARPPASFAACGPGSTRASTCPRPPRVGRPGCPHDARERVRAAVRRLEGDYGEDDWGFDEEFARLVEPGFDFLYDRWWRVKATGLENVPAHGRALLAANHAGILPWDATMMSVAIMREHPLPRYPRFLVLNWAFELPYVSMAIRKVGGVVASPHNALRLLEDDQLVAVFPEGVKGTGKAYAERYRLQRFGRGGFVELALRAGAPIVPVAVVGSEEIYPKLGEAAAAGAAHGRSLLPAHPVVPVAGPGRRGAAAVEVEDRVLRADRDRLVRARRGGRPVAGARAVRARAVDGAAGAVREFGEARQPLRVGSRHPTRGVA